MSKINIKTCFNCKNLYIHEDICACKGCKLFLKPKHTEISNIELMDALLEYSLFKDWDKLPRDTRGNALRVLTLPN